MLLEATTKDSEDAGDSNTRGLVPANGAISTSANQEEHHQLAAFRDVAAALMAICGIASCFMEPSIFDKRISWQPVHNQHAQDWTSLHNYRVMQRVLWMIPVNLFVNSLTFIMVSITSQFPHIQLANLFPLLDVPMLNSKPAMC